MTWQRFKHWWTNVFWYHYGKSTVITLLVLGVVGFAVYDMSKRIQPEFTYVFATDYFVMQEDLDTLTQLFIDETPDMNGDSFVSIYPIAICMQDEESTPFDRLVLTFFNDETYLYIVDQMVADWLLMDDSLTELAPIGFKEDMLYKEKLIRIDDLPIIRSIFKDPEAMYVCLRRTSDNMNDLQKMSFDLSLNAMCALLASN